MNGTDIFPQARDHALIKSTAVHSQLRRKNALLCDPPSSKHTTALVSFFDCILSCTTVCTRSCVLSYCCVFQAGKTQSVISCELRGGFTLPLRPVEPVPWNKKSFRWRAILVLLRTLLASIAVTVEITCCLLFFSTLLLFLCLSSLDDDSVARWAGGLHSRGRTNRRETPR